MSERPLEIGQKLTRLADAILDDLLVQGSDALLEDKIAALKAITTLHLGLTKLGDKVDDEDGTFARLRDRATAGGK